MHNSEHVQHYKNNCIIPQAQTMTGRQPNVILSEIRRLLVTKGIPVGARFFTPVHTGPESTQPPIQRAPGLSRG
jgi:hypothetical protein